MARWWKYWNGYSVISYLDKPTETELHVLFRPNGTCAGAAANDAGWSLNRLFTVDSARERERLLESLAEIG